MKKIVILGNGISGITAARNIRKMSDHELTVISDETDHFFSRTALMYIYMGHMKYEHTKPYEDWFWEENRISLKRGYVTEIDTDNKRVVFDREDALAYDILILAVGSRPNTFGWPGEDLKGVQGLYSYQDLLRMEENTREVSRAVLVGGGLIGIEMAEMLLSRNIPVTFLVREGSFWNTVLPPEESQMVNRHILEHNVDLRLSTELKSIEGGADDRVQGVITNAGDQIACDFVGLTVGVRPSIDFLASSAIETNRGILVNHFFETNIPDVYGIGDCAEFKDPLPGRKAVEQVWYTARMHGETIARTICGTKTAYRPGNWFNSAKFFDIEYQVYGDVKSRPDPNEGHVVWEHHNGKHAIRLVYDRHSEAILGINLMGVRYRHQVCDDWIQRGATIRKVLNELENAAFDPELFKEYSNALRISYNEQHPENPVQISQRKGLLQRILKTV